MFNPESTIARVQRLLSDSGIGGWLFYGFRDNDPIALRVLGLSSSHLATRRWFYLVPATGEPRKLVHRIESAQLDHLPGSKRIYLRWQELQSLLAEVLSGCRQVAMQYSPGNAIPYISRVDAGTVELVRSLGPEVVASGELIQFFECVWDDGQLRQHRETARHLTRIAELAYRHAAGLLRSKGATSEMEIQRFILDQFQESGLVTDSSPIVAVNANSGDPHYQPSEDRNAAIRPNDFLLLDLWAKTAEANSVYADITWNGFFGDQLPPRIGEIFEIVKRSRDNAVDFLNRRFAAGDYPQGWEVDDAAREVIERAGYGAHFVHRTGHNIGQEDHGNGVNFDNLETHDTRRIVPGITCSIEPGIYLPEFGVRSEINVHFAPSGPEITTPSQDSVLVLT